MPQGAPAYLQDAARFRGLAGGLEKTIRRLNAAKLHLLTVREVQTIKNGDHADGGGLYIRVRGSAASFLFRFTSPAGKRCEMGLGVADRGNAAQAGQSITHARELAAQARLQLQKGIDPIDERDRVRDAARAEAERIKELRARDESTLARVPRAYHERVIEPSRTKKHAAQWLNSLEQHVPDAIWNAPIATLTAPQLLDFLIELRKTLA